MSESEKLLSECVAISGAPVETSANAFEQVIKKNVPEANILQLQLQENDNDKKWILQLDSSKSIDILCDEIQEDEITEDNNVWTIAFNYAVASEIPKSWFSVEDKEKAASSMLKIFNLPEDTHRDDIELYFEDKDLFGKALEVKHIEFMEDKTVAVVEFCDGEAIDRVLSKQQLLMEGQTIVAELVVSREEKKAKTIEVTCTLARGLITEKNLETLKRYFSNTKRSGGGKIVNCTFSNAAEALFITFEDPEVAKTVAEKQNHTLKTQPLHVILLDDEEFHSKLKPTSIELSNLPREIDASILEMVFEDVSVFGEVLQVVDVDIDVERSSAKVKFENSEAVETVMKKQPLQIGNRVITVKSQNAEVEELPERTCAIEVSGNSNLINEETIELLKLYFQNTKRSNGGSVTACSLVEPGVATFTFEHPEIARKVAEKDSHEFKSQPIEVKMTSPKLETDSGATEDQSRKVIFTGVTSTIRDIFELTLESMFAVNVVGVEFDEEQSSAVVELETPKEAENILKNQTIVIKDQKLSAKLHKDEPVRSCTIEVQGFPNIKEHMEALQLFFKSAKRTGGGNVTDCSADGESDVAYVTFESEEVAKRVAEKREHIFKEHTLAVSLFIPKKKSKYQTGSFRSRKVRISQLPAGADKYYMGLFFEDFFNSNEVEVQVTDVELDPENASAIVEFSDVAAIDIIQRQPIKMKEQIIEVEVCYEQEDLLNTVEVKGPLRIEKEMDKLQLYFQNTRRSGGGRLLKSSFDREKNTAYFTFESKEVALKVVETNHSKDGYQVTLLRAEKKKPSDQGVKTIRIRGSLGTINKETLTYYFTNERRSGGGQIESTWNDVEDDNVMYITFAQSETAERVVEREHVVEGCVLYVCLFTPPPFYDNKILIKGLKRSTSKDSLTYFLEATVNAELEHIDYHEVEEETVMVTMKNKIDYDMVENVCKERQLEGAYLTVSRVSMSNCIFVSNLAASVNRETVQYYFENKSRGGGDVEKITMNEEEATCLVYFEDYKDYCASVWGYKHYQ